MRVSARSRSRIVGACALIVPWLPQRVQPPSPPEGTREDKGKNTGLQVLACLDRRAQGTRDTPVCKAYSPLQLNALMREAGGCLDAYGHRCTRDSQIGNMNIGIGLMETKCILNVSRAVPRTFANISDKVLAAYVCRISFVEYFRPIF